MKITREALKTIVKETMIEESEYQEFFKKALEKAGGSIPKMSEEEKKAFFNKIEKTWKGKGEKNEISETELEEAQSPAQKAAFAKMLAKKDGKEESTDDKESVKEEIDTKKANQIRKAAAGYVGPKFAKKASDEDILAMADLKDEKASLYNRHLKDIMGKISKLQKKYNIKESIIKEGFSTWEVIFDNMNLSGVKLSKKNKYTIKARNTVEAIKKAAKMAGVKDGQWIATKTHSVTKK